MKTGLKSALLTTLVLGIAEGPDPRPADQEWIGWLAPRAESVFGAGGFLYPAGASHPDLGGLGVRAVRQGHTGAIRPAQGIRRHRAIPLCPQSDVLMGRCASSPGGCCSPARCGCSHMAPFLITALHLFTVLVEEPQLRKRFGKPYEEYCQTVPRWIPRFK